MLITGINVTLLKVHTTKWLHSFSYLLSPIGICVHRMKFNNSYTTAVIITRHEIADTVYNKHRAKL